MDGEGLRIGELAQLAGVSTRMIRHYHHVGVLPEPIRAPNGYRCYQVRDVVLLLRVRQLVELGLRLDEVRDALADSGGREMGEILAQLDADLAAQQQQISERRTRLASVLARAEGADAGVGKEAVLGELSHVAGHDRGFQGRERLTSDVLEACIDPTLTPQVWQAYCSLLGDDAGTQASLELSRAFDALAGVDPGDPAVDAVAARAAGLGEVVLALLPPEVRDGPGDPDAADGLLRVMQVGMDPAQARCLDLMFTTWRVQSS